jgi:hypothetical protein
MMNICGSRDGSSDSSYLLVLIDTACRAHSSSNHPLRLKRSRFKDGQEKRTGPDFSVGSRCFLCSRPDSKLEPRTWIRASLACCIRSGRTGYAAQSADQLQRADILVVGKKFVRNPKTLSFRNLHLNPRFQPMIRMSVTTSRASLRLVRPKR